MKIKEKVLAETEKRIQKRLKQINEILECQPGTRILEIREEFRKLLEENKGIKKRTSPEFIKKIDELSREEKKMLKIAKMPSDETFKLIEESVSLEIELREIETERFCRNKRM